MNKEELVDKIVREWSYRCEKGYPDLENEKDLKILKETFGIEYEALTESKKHFEYLDKDYQDDALRIAQEMGVEKKNLRANTKSRAIFLTDMSRSEFFNKLEEFDFEQKNRNTAKSERFDFEIMHKPLSKQGIKSAGKQNEKSFNDLIQKHIDEHGEPITVRFISKNGKKIEYTGVNSIEDAAASGATKFNKSDSNLLDSNNKVIVGISLKKKNAIRWESSKRRPIGGINVFKQFIKKVGKIGTDNETGHFENVQLTPIDTEKKKYKLYDPVNDKILSKVVVKGIPRDIHSKIIFGKFEDTTIVVKETFEDTFKDYSFENGVLTINVNLLYETVEDVSGTQDEPIFAFSNHIGQSYGIEFRSFSRKVVYTEEGDPKGSSTEISFEDLK